MRTEVIETSGGSVTVFTPLETKASQAKADALIAYGVKVRDWPLVEEAIDAKLDDQAEFVQWWRRSVRRPGNQPNSADRGNLSCEDAETQTGITNQQVSRWRKALKDRDAYRALLVGHARRKAGLDEGRDPDGSTVTCLSGEDEWYTPADIIAMARQVLGEIDLDPASSREAQQTVQAIRFFTEKENGLKQPWSGRVWMNPPYGRGICAEFVLKLVSHVEDGSISAAIVLVHNMTDAAWFQRATLACTRLCLTNRRIRFVRPGGEIGTNTTNGSAIFYFGPDAGRFVTVFSQAGAILRRDDQ